MLTKQLETRNFFKEYEEKKHRTKTKRNLSKQHEGKQQQQQQKMTQMVNKHKFKHMQSNPHSVHLMNYEGAKKNEPKIMFSTRKMVLIRFTPDTWAFCC